MANEWNGLPENPERNGWHWVKDPGQEAAPTLWTLRWGSWWLGDNERSAAYLAQKGYRYLGPCLTPADLAARVEAERERCADEAEEFDREECFTAGGPEQNVCSVIAARIRALGPTPAYDAAIKAAEARGMERAAVWHDAEAKKAGEWRAWGGPPDKALQAKEAFHIEAAAAIRAAAGGGA